MIYGLNRSVSVAFYLIIFSSRRVIYTDNLSYSGALREGGHGQLFGSLNRSGALPTAWFL